MKREDAEEYTESLGQIVSGSWRQIAVAKKLGIPKALGLTVDEWVNNRLGGYIKMSISDRREAVKELAEEGDSTREIADVLGVNQSTVARDITDANASPDENQDEEKQEVTKDPDANASHEPINAIAALSATDEIRDRVKEKSEKNVHVSNNSGENEWYTPPEYIEAARLLLDGISLDPASSEKANEVVNADRFYSYEDDGLTQKWFGRVWLNPPYAQPLISQFCERVALSYDSGEITEAVVLVNNATETKWFQRLADSSSAICFIRGRIKYLDKTGTPANTPLQGQSILYLGRNGNDFAKIFNKFGFVVTHV